MFIVYDIWYMIYDEFNYLLNWEIKEYSKTYQPCGCDLCCCDDILVYSIGSCALCCPVDGCDSICDCDCDKNKSKGCCCNCFSCSNDCRIEYCVCECCDQCCIIDCCAPCFGQTMGSASALAFKLNINNDGKKQTNIQASPNRVEDMKR